MKIQPLQANVTLLTFSSGAQVLFSYETPVAIQFPDGQRVKTSTRFSQTTTRHINKYLPTQEEVSQEDIEELVESWRKQ